jgi:hypothetical protein
MAVTVVGAHRSRCRSGMTRQRLSRHMDVIVTVRCGCSNLIELSFEIIEFSSASGSIFFSKNVSYGVTASCTWPQTLHHRSSGCRNPSQEG